jgi:SAM-dependent methyltransferase
MATDTINCKICAYHEEPRPENLGQARGNTRRFRDQHFGLWQCPRCHAIHSIDPVDFENIYADYPLNVPRAPDYFARMTMSNLLARLKKAGMVPGSDILDFGCGNGQFLKFLVGSGYPKARGFDPFVQEYAEPPGTNEYDVVIANDVVEHTEDPLSTVEICLKYLRPGGILYVGAPESDSVSMQNLERDMTRLHQPFHRVIWSRATIQELGKRFNLEVIEFYVRSYLDTLYPFANYRFLDEFIKALDHNMDRAIDPTSGKIVAKKPMLVFYGLFGYFFPSAMEPAIVLKKP